MQEIKIEIFGRVQGIGFRHFTKDHADKLGLKGFVRNTDQGSALVIAQGDKKKLEELLKIVQKGPILTHVEGVSYFWKKAENNYSDFVIALDKGIIEDQKRNFLNLGKSVLNIKDRIPRHIAIIPDGNRRWATKRGLNILMGHKKSTTYERIIALLEEAEQLGIKYITVWGFSTENWRRDSEEIKNIFGLILKGLKRFRKEAKKNQIRFRHLGRKDRLPKKLIEEISKLEEETKEFDKFNIQLCIDYGGRDEITRAINKLLRSGVKEIKEDDLSRYLDSNDIPDPDLIIRTSGEKRTSGFMPFQSIYAELYFADVGFPDFGPEELRKAVEEFAERKRKFGK